MNYAKFAAFYDEIMGDRTPDIDQVRQFIGKHQPTATSLLELGCGTGALLAGLSASLDVTGVDQSAEMLAIAAQSVPKATLITSDMTKFKLDARFDVVICMFDTLNHLPEFASWLELFDRVHEHLSKDGLFIFDVNTTGRLHGLSRATPYVQDFGDHALIMNITPAHGNVVLWETKIFERLGDDDLYRLHHERIYELGVPLDTIREALSLHFEVLEETDFEDGPVSDDSDRIYFACRHKG
jgi:SAM-dependent methyltransferase